MPSSSLQSCRIWRMAYTSLWLTAVGTWPGSKKEPSLNAMRDSRLPCLSHHTCAQAAAAAAVTSLYQRASHLCFISGPCTIRGLLICLYGYAMRSMADKLP